MTGTGQIFGKLGAFREGKSSDKYIIKLSTGVKVSCWFSVTIKVGRGEMANLFATCYLYLTLFVKETLAWIKLVTENCLRNKSYFLVQNYTCMLIF